LLDSRPMRLQAPHCPACGAPIVGPPGGERVVCDYCQAVLVVAGERVTHRPPPPPRASEAAPAPFPQPEATLHARELARFEISVIEQRLPGERGELFTWRELEGQRFALTWLRGIDKDGRPVAVDLKPGLEALERCLHEDGDPGLAACRALEALCANGFAHRLECVCVLFDPRRMTATAYSAGARGALTWVSSEEGRPIVPNGNHDALERRSLREARDHFSNMAPIHLVAHDLVVVGSAGFMGRGPGATETRLRDTLNEHLGEAPLRIVSLAKNAFWDARNRTRAASLAPVGDVVLAAVRAVLPPVLQARPGDALLEAQSAGRFEWAMLRSPGDEVVRLPLHGDREAIVWLSPVAGALDAAAVQRAAMAVGGVLDRRDHGDNENPRRAGREALAAMGAGAGQVRLAVIQLLHQHRRVKYFRAGWKQPIALGDRGIRGDSLQQFDEGGEATVREGSRLFFPGSLPFEGEFGDAQSLAAAWAGGKASHLYEALVAHWKTRRTGPALERLALGASSDVPEASLAGLLLVTGT